MVQEIEPRQPLQKLKEDPHSQRGHLGRRIHPGGQLLRRRDIRQVQMNDVSNACYCRSGVDEGRVGVEEEQQEGQGDYGYYQDYEADAVALVVVVVGVAEEEDQAEEEGREHGEPAQVAVYYSQLQVEQEHQGHHHYHVDLLPRVVFPLCVAFYDEVAQHEADQPADGRQGLYGGLVLENVVDDLPPNSGGDGEQKYPLEADYSEWKEVYC